MKKNIYKIIMKTQIAVNRKKTDFLNISSFPKPSKIKSGLNLGIMNENKTTMKGCRDDIHFIKVTEALPIANIIHMIHHTASNDCKTKFQEFDLKSLYQDITSFLNFGIKSKDSTINHDITGVQKNKLIQSSLSIKVYFVTTELIDSIIEPS